MQHWFKFLDKNMQRNGRPFTSPINTRIQILHNQQINRIYYYNKALSQVFGACGMEVVQQQRSPRLSNNLQYKNVKAISKKSSYFKKMKTFNNWQVLSLPCHLRTARRWYTSFEKHLVCCNYIHSFSPSAHFVYSTHTHTPPTPLPDCLFLEVHYNSSHIKVIHP